MNAKEKAIAVTRADFMQQIGVIWMFIAFSFGVQFYGGSNKVFLAILFSVSSLMTAVYMGYGRVLARRDKA